MMTFNQILLATQIEYHWWRIRSLRKKNATTVQKKSEKLSAAENLHRYKAEKASIQYEITVGLRDYKSIWI